MLVSSDTARIDVNGASLAYLEEGDGEPLLFVHGSASDLRTWEHQASAFANEYRTIAYSRRFHFPNEPIPKDAKDAIEVHVHDLRRLIEELSAMPANVVAHSWGGLVALLLAFERPALLRSLTLIEPPVISLHIDAPPTPGSFARLLFRSPRLAIALAKFASAVLGPSEKAFRKNDDEAAVAIFGRGVLGRDRFDNLSSARYQQVWDNRGPDRAQALFGTFPRLSDASLSGLHLPVLLISGAESPRIFRLLMDDLARRIPHAQRAEISSASHIVHEDSPEEFNLRLRAFLENSTGPIGGSAQR